MSHNNKNSGCFDGCASFPMLIFCGFIIFFLIKNDASIFYILIFLFIGIFYYVHFRRLDKKNKTVVGATDEAKQLILKLTKDLLKWKDELRLSFYEHIPGRAAVLQISRSHKKIAILQYDAFDLTADFRVYRFSELKSWQANVKTEQYDLILCRPEFISTLSVELTFYHAHKTITHEIILYQSSRHLDKNHQLYTLQHIRDFLSNIKPEKNWHCVRKVA